MGILAQPAACLLAIFAVIFLLPHTALKDREKRQIDYLGSIILMAGTSALVLATIWGGNQYAWNSPADYWGFSSHPPSRP